jgi:hypothetical protein
MASRQIEPLELDVIYWLMGKALRELQYLEVTIANFLTLKLDIRTRYRVPEEEAHRMLAKRLKNTLGEAIGFAREGKAIDQPLLTRLAALNQERHWLVHRSVAQNGDDLYEEAGRRAVMDRLEAFSREALALDKAMCAKVEKWSAAQGIDTAATSRAAEAQLDALRGGMPRLFTRLGRWLGSRGGR